MAGPCSAIGSEFDCRSKGRELDPNTFVEIDHEIYLWSISSLR